MAAYCFFDVHEVLDERLMSEYRQKVIATVQQHGGKYLLVGGRIQPMEGSWRPTFPVLIEFPNLEQAQKWYQSDQYRPLLALRQKATRCDAVFLGD